MTDRARRAEEARQKILDSGDPDLIRRLQLLEATAPQQPAAADRTPAPPPSPAPGPWGAGRGSGGGPSLLGMGLAVAGGAWLGTVLGGMTLSPAMAQAFSDVAEDLGIDMDGVDLTELEDGSEGMDASGDATDPGGEGFGDFGGDFLDF